MHIKRSAKEMGLILYRCPNDFPDRIPGILADMSPEVICERGPQTGSGFDSAYTYIVTRGKARIMIHGDHEDGFMSVTIVDGSRSLLGGRARMELAADVTGALLAAGMKEVTAEELQELEAQRKP
jgi:hypothetical protein